MVGGIDTLGQRQVIPRWEDDPMRRHIGIGVVGSGGGRRGLTPPEGNWEAGRDGGAGQVNKYISIIERT